MPQQPSSDFNGLTRALDPLVRQLERLEDRVRDVVTRTDLELLRKDLVAREALEPQLNALTAQIARTDADRAIDRIALEKRIDDLENEQITRQDKLWIRIGQVLAIAAFALALFSFLSHVKFL